MARCRCPWWARAVTDAAGTVGGGPYAARRPDLCNRVERLPAIAGEGEPVGRRRWWRPLVRECQAADPELFDEWDREFLLGLAEQDGIQPDQLSILSDLAC